MERYRSIATALFSIHRAVAGSESIAGQETYGRSGRRGQETRAERVSCRHPL
jgi:hypothetical protein